MAPKNTSDFAPDFAEFADDDEIIELTEIVEKGNPPEQSMTDTADDDLFGGSGGSDVDFEKELEDLFSGSDSSIGDFDDIEDTDGGYTSTEKSASETPSGDESEGTETAESGGMDFESELDDLLGGLDDSASTPSESAGRADDGAADLGADGSPDFESELDDLLGGLDGDTKAASSGTSQQELPDPQDSDASDSLFGGNDEDDEEMDFGSELDDLLGSLDESPDSSSTGGQEPEPSAEEQSEGPVSDDDIEALLNGFDGPPSDSAEMADAADTVEQEPEAATAQEQTLPDDDEVDFSELDALIEDMEVPSRVPKPEPSEDDGLPDLSDLDSMMEEAAAGDAVLGREDDADTDSSDSDNFDELSAQQSAPDATASEAPAIQNDSDDSIDDLLAEFDIDAADLAAPDVDDASLSEIPASDKPTSETIDDSQQTTAAEQATAPDSNPDPEREPEPEPAQEASDDLDAAWATAAETDDTPDTTDIDSELDDLLAGLDDDLGLNTAQPEVQTATGSGTAAADTEVPPDDAGEIDDLDALLNSFDEEPEQAAQKATQPEMAPAPQVVSGAGEDEYVFNPDESLDAPDMTDLDALLESLDGQEADTTTEQPDQATDTSEPRAADHESMGSPEDLEDIPDLDELLASEGDTPETATSPASALSEEQSDEDLLNELLAAADDDLPEIDAEKAATEAEAPSPGNTPADEILADGESQDDVIPDAVAEAAAPEEVATEQSATEPEEPSLEDVMTDDAAAKTSAPSAPATPASSLSDESIENEAVTEDTSMLESDASEAASGPEENISTSPAAETGAGDTPEYLTDDLQPDQSSEGASSSTPEQVTASGADTPDFLESPASAHETRDDIMTAVGPETLEAGDTEQFDTDYLDVEAPEDEADIDALLGEVLGEGNAPLTGDDADDLPDLSIMGDSFAAVQSEPAFTENTEESELTDIADGTEATPSAGITPATGEVTIDENIDDFLKYGEYGADTQDLDSMIDEAAECVGTELPLAAESDTEALTIRIASLEAALENLISGLPSGIITEDTVEDIVDRKMAEHDALEEAETVPESTERSLYTTVEGVLDTLLADDSPVMQRILERIDGHVQGIINEKLPRYGEELRDDLKDYASRSAAKATADIIKEELIPLLEPLMKQ